MNNDFQNNHSSMSSNKYIANNNYPSLKNFYQESYIKGKNKEIFDDQSKGNRTNFFESDNDKKLSNQKSLFISNTLSKNPSNYEAGPNPYNDGVTQGYYINVKDGQRYQNNYQIPLEERDNEEEEENENENENYYDQNQLNIENGAEDIDDEDGNYGEDEEEIENGNQYENILPQKSNAYNNQYIGDGIVRSNINNISNYSPNQNGQNISNIPYQRKKYLNQYNNINNYNYNNNYYGQENENENQYIESPSKQNIANKYNNQEPYRRRHILGNLEDSVSSEAYANKIIRKSSNNSDTNSKIYIKPRTQYNNNINNGISTEERGIESKKESTNIVAKNGSYSRSLYQNFDSEGNKYKIKINYDEDSQNVVEPPIFNYPKVEKIKGGKVDLNHFNINKYKEKQINKEEKEILEEYKIDEKKIIYIIKLQKYVKAYYKVKEIKATQIQSFWRGRSTRRVMILYNGLDEFIYIISKVYFNHFSDNFYFFINQLFNVYKANTLKNNQIDSLGEEKEDEEKEKEDNENDEEEEKIDENNTNNKKYEDLLKDYNNLQKKYNELKNKNYKSATKKSLNNNDVVSVPGETTIGTIKTDNNKLKFRSGHNNSTNKINKENLTFSNEYNYDEGDIKEYERHFYTPNIEDEDSFNDNSKEKKFTYSSIQSEENSKYFDNEQPSKGATSSKRSINFRNKANNPKIALLSLNKKKDKILSYSPSFENERQSIGNSNNKNSPNDNNPNQNNINNIISLSVIMPKHEEGFGIESKKIEELYNKYAVGYSKDLRIVKNNKIYLDNKEEKKKGDKTNKLYCFDNENMFPENENTIELLAPPKSDNEKINELLDNEKLFNKLKKRINNIILKRKIELSKNVEYSFTIENKKNNDIIANINNEIEKKNINNFEIIQNNHRNFSKTKLDFESNEIFIGEPQILINKKKLKKLIPILEHEINLENTNVPKKEKIRVFQKEKTLPSFIENNIFTIYRNLPQIEPKLKAFIKEKTIIDNLYNNEFIIKESKTKKEKEIEVKKGKDNSKEKKIIYLPFKEGAFKRLRRSKRTKDTYFTIKSDSNYISNKIKDSTDILQIVKECKIKQKEDLSQIQENNFTIKSEYYYVETKDGKIPEIIEKKIKETIFINKLSQESISFNKDKTIFSNQNKFYIKGSKNRNIYLEDIEKNELTICSFNKKGTKNKKDEIELSRKKDNRLRNKYKKVKGSINKNEEFTINGKKKKWDELDPIANEEFSYRNDGLEENEYENELYENKDNIDNFDRIKDYNLDNIEQFEIIDKIKEKNTCLSQTKESEINIKGRGIEKEDKELQIDIKQLKITTKKIVKKEKILSRKKFINNKIKIEESFSIIDKINKNIKKRRNNIDNYNQSENKRKKYIQKELILVKEKICELSFKQLRNDIKDKETEIEQRKDFKDKLSITNDEFINIKTKKIKSKEIETQITNELVEKKNEDIKKEIILENIKNGEIIIKGKKKKMKESETEINDELINIKPYYNNEIILKTNKKREKENNNNIIIKNQHINIIAPEKEIILEKYKIEGINLESKNRFFPKLSMKNLITQTINGKKKEKIKLEYFKNESIMFEPIKEEENKDEKNNFTNYIIEGNNEISQKSDKKEIEKDEKCEDNQEKIKKFNFLNINKVEEYNILGKEKEISNDEKPEKEIIKKKKMKEMETQIYNDLNINIPESSNELNYKTSESKYEENEESEKKTSILRGKKKEKYENVLNSIEKIQLFIEGTKRDKVFLEKEKREQVKYLAAKNIKIFMDLKINKFKEEIINMKEKQKLNIKSTQNEPILLNVIEGEKLENIKGKSIIFNGKLIEKPKFENIQNESFIFSGEEKQIKPLENIKIESINYNGKIPLENIKNESINYNGKEKEIKALENIKSESFILGSLKKDVKPLESIKIETFIFQGKKKEIKPLESVQNESIIYNNKKSIREIKNYIGENINSELIPNKNQNFILNQIKNKTPNIKNNNIKKIMPLIIEEQQPLNINKEESSKIFNNKKLSICYSENFAIKIKEEYEGMPIELIEKRNLSQKFNKLLNSDNSNEIYNPQLNINMINNLIVTTEERFEIIKNSNQQYIENKIRDKKNIEEEKEILNDSDIQFDNNKDLDTNLTKQFINNMVQDRLEKEKKKNMDQTKNKLITVIKVIKLKNAICKNVKNKNYFMNRLKEINKEKERKQSFYQENIFNYNYILNKIEKKEEGTDTESLEQIYKKKKISSYEIQKGNDIVIISKKKEEKINIPSTIEKEKKMTKNKIKDKLNEIEQIENYQFSIIIQNKEKKEKKKVKAVRHRKNISMPLSSFTSIEAKENESNISGKSKNKEEKEFQIEPLKELKIATKKTMKKEDSTNKKFLNVQNIGIESFSYISDEDKKEAKLREKFDFSKKVETKEESCQTPKLRPATKAPKKVVFHEIKTIIKKEPKPINQYIMAHTTDYKLAYGKKLSSKEIIKDKIIEEEEDKNEMCNKIFRIEKFQNLFNIFNKNKIETLKIICWIKWKYISSTNKEYNNKFTKLIMKYPRLFAMRLLNIMEKYIDIKGGTFIIKNAINKNIFKKLKNTKVIKKRIPKKRKLKKDKIRNACEQIKSILKKYAGKYLFSIYKKSEKEH